MIQKIGKMLGSQNVKQSKEYKILTDCQAYFNKQLFRNLNGASYNKFSVIDSKDEDRIKFTKILTKMFKSNQKINPKQLQLDFITNRGVACLLGLAVCDALGACTQFMHFVKDRRDLINYDFKDIEKQIQLYILQSRHGKINVWTDDCSMALCMADSLIMNKYKFDARHIRYMFHMWLYHGLDNGGRFRSIGLGGNIKISMDQFCQDRRQYTKQKDRYNNGNGSLMRLAPIPMCFSKNPQLALTMSQNSSKTTHNGDEAKQCCKLLALILVRLINRPFEQQNNWKQILNQSCQDFANSMQTTQSVRHLAQSKQQPQQLFDEQLQKYKQKFSKFNKSPQEDRNWNWKDKNFTYSKCRNKLQPDYIGSYCMDALAMALHTVWHSSSFQEIALWNANMGGDCDTVGAIAGQIGGAIYGINQYMLHLYSQMEDAKSEKYQVFLKGYKIMMNKEN